MSLLLSLPLSDYVNDSLSYYVETSAALGAPEQDLDTKYRLIGYAPQTTGTFNGLIPITRPPKVYILALNINIPLRQKSLLSGVLNLSLRDNLPTPGPDRMPNPNNDPEQDLALPRIDSRIPDIQRSPSNNFPIDIFTPRSNTPISNYNDVTISDLVVSNIFNIDNRTSNLLNVTSFLSFHINSNRNWLPNTNVSLIASGVNTTGIPPVFVSGGIAAVDFDNSSLDLYYKIVPPLAPNILSITESAYKQVSLSWTEPDDGGGDISKYIVQYSDFNNDNGFPIGNWINIAEPTSTQTDIVNLPLNRPLTFRVVAINSAGSGQFSSASSSISLSKNKGPVSSLTFNDANLTRLRIRRDVSTEWNKLNPILALGEIAYETTTNRLKIGDGLSFWSGLPYVTIDQSSIDFPEPPTISLTITDSVADKIVMNLSNNDKLGIIAEDGVAIDYNNDTKQMSIGIDTLYNPISSGTIVNPASSGVPGSLLYDDTWLYFCTNNNYWQRTSIDKAWTNFSDMVISSSSDNFGGLSSLIFNYSTGIFSTDLDPYPALAGSPLTNTSERTFFNIPTLIQRENKVFRFIYRGGKNSSNPSIINVPNEIVGIMFNGAAVKSCNIGAGALNGFVAAPNGFSYNFDIQNKTKASSDNCGGYPNPLGQYAYRDGSFLKNCWNIPLVYGSNGYYNNSHYDNDHFRHSNGHSKILGFCLDGYPIYGPFAYNDPLDKNSDISLMRSSYSGLATDDHRPISWKYNNTLFISNFGTYSLSRGMFIEDFVYVENLGHLDQFNGRFAVTPEFPNGTYSYYLTFSDDSLTVPEFPYIFGRQTKEQRYNNV